MDAAPVQGSVLEALPDGVVGIDVDQRISSINRAGERIFGYAAGDLVGHPLVILLPECWRARHPQLASRFLASTEDAKLMHERQPVEGLRRDGTTFPAEVTLVKGRAGPEPWAFAIVRDISLERRRQADLEATERRLRDALREAEASIQAKRIFLANMTHELRTPLNAIIGFAELIEREIYGPHSHPAYKEYGTLIRGGGEHLLSIVNDLLDLSSLELGKVPLHEESVDILALALECKRMLAPTLEKAGLRLYLNIQALLSVRADKRALKQMLINLIANAIKFTGPGGSIRITGRIDEGRPVLTVKDSGSGIEPERLGKITEPFGDRGTDQPRRNGGTGIGLSITKGLIERHGGVLEIRSVLGKGTAVFLRFPPQDAPNPFFDDAP